MQLTSAMREKACQLLAADTSTLAQAVDQNKIALLVGDFPESESVSFDVLTLASFDGSTPKLVELGVQPEGLDPVSGDSLITIVPPVGCWRWETSGLTHLPQQITGFALLKNDGTTLMGVERLATPITLTAINQVINLPPIVIRQKANSMV